jgi:DNA mismatch repair ATPase MutL
VYLPKPAHRKLKEIAFHTDKKVHDLIMEGIDEVLKRHGHPTSGELKASTKAP